MFRFKTFSIALLILLVGAAAFVGDTILQMRSLESRLETELLAGRLVSERSLREMVERNVNRSVDLARDDTVAQALRDLSAGGEFEELAERILPYLSKWMEEREPADRPDWVMVIDPQGKVLFRSEAPKERGDSIVSIPLVRHMLMGAALDALWTMEERVYSVSAAATLAGDKIVGGVLLGFRLDERTLSRMSVDFSTGNEMPKFGMAISWNGSPMAKSFVLEQGTRIPTTAEPTPFGDGTTKYHPFPLLTPQRGLHLGATLPTAGWPERMQLTVTVPHAAAFEPMAERQIVILAATLLLLLISLAWGQSINRAVTRPLTVIVEHLSGVQQGSNVGLLPEVALKEPYRRLGKLVNMLISSRSAPVMSAAPTRGDDISQILGDSPAEPDSGQDEDFQFPGLGGGLPETPQEEIAQTDPPAAADSPAAGLASLFEDSPAAPPAPEELAPPVDQRPPAEIGSADFFQSQPAEAEPPSLDPEVAPSIDSMAASAFDNMVAPSMPAADAPPLQPDVFAAPAPAGPPADPGAFALPEMSAPAAANAADPAPEAGAAAGTPPGWNPERTVMVQVPEELIAASAEPAPPGMAPVDDDEEYDPGATVVAPISEDMLSAAMAEEPVDPETAHFKDVYEQFIATRRECGESIDELTFDRFLVKLRKNREALIQKYSCRTVRFQVYVKAGKAALKAVPVRD